MTRIDWTEWPDFLADQTRRWLGTAVNWTLYADELLIVHYEDVKNDPLPELRRILAFLELPVDEERLACIEVSVCQFRSMHPTKTVRSVQQQNHPQGKFQRRKGRWREQWSADKAFPDEMRSSIDRAIRYVDYLARRAGQPPVPFQSYGFYERAAEATATATPADDTSWLEWLSRQWASRVVKSLIEDPLTAALRDGAQAGGLYAWRVPLEPGHNETQALERDFNSGPPPSVLHYRRA